MQRELDNQAAELKKIHNQKQWKPNETLNNAQIRLKLEEGNALNNNHFKTTFQPKKWTITYTATDL